MFTLQVGLASFTTIWDAKLKPSNFSLPNKFFHAAIQLPGAMEFILPLAQGPAQLNHVLFCDVGEKKKLHRTQERDAENRLLGCTGSVDKPERKPTSSLSTPCSSSVFTWNVFGSHPDQMPVRKLCPLAFSGQIAAVVSCNHLQRSRSGAGPAEIV